MLVNSSEISNPFNRLDYSVKHTLGNNLISFKLSLNKSFKIKITVIEKNDLNTLKENVFFFLKDSKLN